MPAPNAPAAPNASVATSPAARASQPAWRPWQLAASVALAALGVWTSGAIGALPALPAVLVLAAITPPLVLADLREHRLPNRLVLVGASGVAVGVVVAWVSSGSLPLVAVVSGAGFGVFLLAFNLAGGLGMGDVKLGAVLGLAAGLLGPTATVLTPLLAFVLGGGAAAVVAARRGRTARLPFGPWLLAGFWCAVLAVGVLRR